MNIYLIIVNQFLSKKIIISERTDPNYAKNGLIKFFRDKIYKFSNNFLVVQNKDQEGYFKTKISEDKVILINNPIALKNSFIKITDDLKFLSIGRLEKEKNQIELIQIFKELNFNYTLEILGKGSLETKLKNFVREQELNGKIHFLGVKKDMERYLSPYSIFVSTSLFEGFPNALIEAMNHKMVCVHYHCKGLEDIISDGENGYLIPMGNQQLFKTRIEELKNNKELRIKIGENAHRSIRHLDIDNISKQWINLIEN